jgi:hypothetical protein
MAFILKSDIIIEIRFYVMLIHDKKNQYKLQYFSSLELMTRKSHFFSDMNDRGGILRKVRIKGNF